MRIDRPQYQVELLVMFRSKAATWKVQNCVLSFHSYVQPAYNARFSGKRENFSCGK